MMSPSWGTGDVIRAEHVQSGHVLYLLVEVEKAAKRSTGNNKSSGLSVRLAPKHAPYTRLSVGQNGRLKWGGKAGRFCVFEVLPVNEPVGHNEASETTRVRFVSAPNAAKRNCAGGTGWHLGLTMGCQAHNLIGDAAADGNSVFAVTVEKDAEPRRAANTKDLITPAEPLATAHAKLFSEHESNVHIRGFLPPPLTVGPLNAQDLFRFYEDGYLVLRHAKRPLVSIESVLDARAMLNRALGTPGDVVPGGLVDEDDEYDEFAGAVPSVEGLVEQIRCDNFVESEASGKLRGGYGSAAPIKALLTDALAGEGAGAFAKTEKRCGSLVLAAAEQLLGGPGCTDLSSSAGAQIALRFPGRSRSRCAKNSDTAAEDVLPGTRWHVDGMRQGKAHPFSLLVGVALSDVRAPFCGNLCVFPGSHRRIEPLLLPDGKLRGYEQPQFDCAGMRSGDMDRGIYKGKRPPQSPVGVPDMGTPKQLLLRTGDVVLLHPSLAHRGAPNRGADVRYAVYFRLRHCRRHELRTSAKETEKDVESALWAELEGLSSWLDMRTRAAKAAAKAALVSMTAAMDALNAVVMAASVLSEVVTANSAGAALSRGSRCTDSNGAAIRSGHGHNLSPLSHVPNVLSAAQIACFKQDGVLVVPNMLDHHQLVLARRGMAATMRAHGVEGVALGTNDKDDNVNNDAAAAALNRTANALAPLSSTGGAGGVLDLFYDDWKLQVTLRNVRYAKAMSQLYDATYAADVDHDKSSLWQHVHGPFDSTKLFAHVDRVGFRVPDSVSRAHSSGPRRPLQRSLTPHLDCCPRTMLSGAESFGASGKQLPRWRPIQCLLSLSDTSQANYGGFEAVRGFHHEFAAYYEACCVDSGVADSTTPISAPPLPRCVFDYCHIRPREDASIISRFEHIACPAGGAIFWDQRIPHANARNHLGHVPRAVVYGGFMPRVRANENYVREQLKRMRAREVQPDFWLDETVSKGAQVSSEYQGKKCTDPVAFVTTTPSSSTSTMAETGHTLSTRLAQHLLGLDLGHIKA